MNVSFLGDGYFVDVDGTLFSGIITSIKYTESGTCIELSHLKVVDEVPYDE